MKTVDKQELSELQRKGLEQVEKSSDYQIKAAKEGSEYDFVDYWYSPEEFQKCQWCGNGRCKHMYVIEHEEDGHRLSVGSTCIEKIMGLGSAYSKHEDFKEKIDTLAEMKGIGKSDLAEEYGDELLTLGEIEEEIEKAKEKEKEKINTQKERLKEENLWQLKGLNSFVNDVLNQAEERKLSDKQIESLKENRDELLEDYESVEEWNKEYKEQHKIIKGLRLVRHLRRARRFRRRANDNYQEVARDMIDQWNSAYRRPCLSDAQIEYAEDIIENEADKIKEMIKEEYSDLDKDLDNFLDNKDIDEEFLKEYIGFSEEELSDIEEGSKVVCTECNYETEVAQDTAKVLEDMFERDEPWDCPDCEAKMEVEL